jgi:hypothetical protein
VYYLAACHHSSQESTLEDPPAVFARSFEVHVTGLIHYLDAARLRQATGWKPTLAFAKMIATLLPTELRAG